MVFISGGNELLDASSVLRRAGVSEGMTVADLGCGGAGHFVIPAANIVGEKGVAYAVDVLKVVLQAVSSKARVEGVNNLKTVWSNLEVLGATNIAGDSLDVAFLINILFQSKKDEAIIQEAYRLVKPNGKLLIVDWNKTSSALGPSMIDRPDPAKLKKVAQDVGFKLTDEFNPGEYHFGLIFEK